MSHFNFTVMEGTLSNYNPEKGEFTLTCNRSKDKVSIPVVINSEQLKGTCAKYLKNGSRVLISGPLVLPADDLSLEAKEVNFLQQGEDKES